MNTYGIYSDNDIQFHYLRTEQPDASTFKMHTHDCCELYYFLSDHAVFHVEGNEYHLKYGDLLIMHPMEAHYIELDPSIPYERAALHFKGSLFSSFDPEETLIHPFYHREPGCFNLFHAEDFPDLSWKSCLSQLLLPAENRRLQIITALIPLLNELHKAALNRPSTAVENNALSVQVIRYINYHITEPLSIETLCNHFYVSQSQLCRIFKRATGASIGEYITTKRLLRAQQILRSGTPATKVLTDSGFNDYSSFYRAYRKYFGYSPSHTIKTGRQTD